MEPDPRSVFHDCCHDPESEFYTVDKLVRAVPFLQQTTNDKSPPHCADTALSAMHPPIIYI